MNSTTAKDINDMVSLLKEAMKMLEEDISNYHNPHSSFQFYNLTLDSNWKNKTKEILERWKLPEEILSKQQLD